MEKGLHRLAEAAKRYHRCVIATEKEYEIYRNGGGCYASVHNAEYRLDESLMELKREAKIYSASI